MSCFYEKEEESKHINLLELEQDGLVYEETKDSDYLEQFLKLRKEVFAEYDVLSHVLDFGEGWDYGLDTRVLIAREGNRVVAGAIFIINNCYVNEFFPFEKAESISLYKKLPELSLDKNCYSAFKQTVVHKDYRGAKCLENMFRYVYNCALINGVRFIFAVAHSNRVRINRISFHKLRVGLDIIILENVKFPELELCTGAKVYLQMLVLRSNFSSVYFK